jgi:hypothetical protein
MRHILLKRRLTFNGIRGVVSQKVITLLAVRPCSFCKERTKTENSGQVRRHIKLFALCSPNKITRKPFPRTFNDDTFIRGAPCCNSYKGILTMLNQMKWTTAYAMTVNTTSHKGMSSIKKIGVGIYLTCLM